MIEKTIAGLRCSDVLSRLSDYLDEELSASEVERIEAHLLECPNCARFGDNFGSMVVALRRDPDRGPVVDSGLVTRLLSQIDALGLER